MSLENPLLMFMALFALYSPLAAVSSYFPIISGMKPGEQLRLSIGLFTYVSMFALTALWIGEPLLELLGITTAALTVTGGIALMYAAIPLMRGLQEEAPAEGPKEGPAAESTASEKPELVGWKKILFMPVFFPLTVGGTTFAIIVSFRSSARNVGEVLWLSLAALCYAAVTGLTIFVSGHIERRVAPKTKVLLERVAGILLVAIATMLFASGAPRMVVDTLKSINRL